MASNLEKLKARLDRGGATLSGITWGPEADKLSVDERAGVVLAILEREDDPRIALIGKLRGRAFLFNDSASRMRNKFDTKTMQPVEMTREEKSKADDYSSLASLLREAADMLENDAK